MQPHDSMHLRGSEGASTIPEVPAHLAALLFGGAAHGRSGANSGHYYSNTAAANYQMGSFGGYNGVHSALKGGPYNGQYNDQGLGETMYVLPGPSPVPSALPLAADPHGPPSHPLTDPCRHLPPSSDAGEPPKELRYVFRPFYKLLDYKSCDNVLCLNKDIARALLPDPQSLPSTHQIEVTLIDRDSRRWAVTYRAVPQRYSYEFRAGWKRFSSTWRVQKGDVIALWRSGASRTTLHIDVIPGCVRKRDPTYQTAFELKANLLSGFGDGIAMPPLDYDDLGPGTSAGSDGALPGGDAEDDPSGSDADRHATPLPTRPAPGGRRRGAGGAGGGAAAANGGNGRNGNERRSYAHHGGLAMDRDPDQDHQSGAAHHDALLRGGSGVQQLGPGMLGVSDAAHLAALGVFGHMDPLFQTPLPVGVVQASLGLMMGGQGTGGHPSSGGVLMGSGSLVPSAVAADGVNLNGLGARGHAEDTGALSPLRLGLGITPGPPSGTGTGGHSGNPGSGGALIGVPSPEDDPLTLSGGALGIDLGLGLAAYEALAALGPSPTLFQGMAMGPMPVSGMAPDLDVEGGLGHHGGYNHLNFTRQGSGGAGAMPASGTSGSPPVVGTQPPGSPALLPMIYATAFFEAEGGRNVNGAAAASGARAGAGRTDL